MPGTSDTFTSSNRLDKQPTGGNYNKWGQYLNTNFDLIDDLKDGNLLLSMSTTQHTLTVNNAATDEARMASVTLIGSPGGTATVTVPNVPKLTWFNNLLTGGWPAVITNGTGTSYTLTNDGAAMVQCDAAGNINSLAGNATVNGTQYLQIGLHSIFIPAKAFSTGSSGGDWGSATTLQCTTSSRPVDTIVFGTASAQYAGFTIDKMPKSWDRQGIDVVARGFTTGNSGSQKVALNVGVTDIVSGVSVDRPFNYTGDMLGTEASTASFEVETGSATASVSGGTASVGAGLGIMIRRNTTSANNTLTGNFFLTGVLVRYNCNLPNDA